MPVVLSDPWSVVYVGCGGLGKFFHGNVVVLFCSVVLWITTFFVFIIPSLKVYVVTFIQQVAEKGVGSLYLGGLPRMLRIIGAFFVVAALREAAINYKTEKQKETNAV